MTRCARTANGATRREWSRQLPGTPRPPSTRAATPTPPNDALWGESRHDHPDAPARRRGHPWPLEHASAVPTIAGHGAQRAVHNPAAEAHATSTRRSDDQKPCSGRNLDRESPPIIHGAPDLRAPLALGPPRADSLRREAPEGLLRDACAAGAAVVAASWMPSSEPSPVRTELTLGLSIASSSSRSVRLRIAFTSCPVSDKWDSLLLWVRGSYSNATKPTLAELAVARAYWSQEHRGGRPVSHAQPVLHD